MIKPITFPFTPYVFRRVYLHETELMDQIFRLRYEVYGNECGFISKEDYPDERETDHYESQSIHIAALTSDNTVIGSLRMIFNGDYKLPLEKVCNDVNLTDDMKDVSVEISRLIIGKRLRKKIEKSKTYTSSRIARHQTLAIPSSAGFLNFARPVAFGLTKAAHLECQKNKIKNWYALMEPGLWLLLKMYGFRFERIGDEVDMFGSVHPYHVRLSEIQKSIVEYEFGYEWHLLMGYECSKVAQRTQPLTSSSVPTVG